MGYLVVFKVGLEVGMIALGVAAKRLFVGDATAVTTPHRADLADVVGEVVVGGVLEEIGLVAAPAGQPVRVPIHIGIS